MDLAILYGIQQVIGCPFLDALMPVITACGDHGLIWIVVGIVLLIIPKTRRWGVTLLVTLGITWVICEFGVKELLARPRPFVVDPSYVLLIAPPSGYSLPSGHTLTAFIASPRGRLEDASKATRRRSARGAVARARSARVVASPRRLARVHRLVYLCDASVTMG